MRVRGGLVVRVRGQPSEYGYMCVGNVQEKSW